jgi:two-component system alkaline phosphatase synthesis response regulator PhoP
MRHTVLVIDDEPEILKLLDHNLTRAGYVVITAKDGERGLEAVRRHRPDLVILDVMLPGMDGWDVCKGIKGDPVTAGTALLMLTARGEEENRILGLELGADDYVTKPFGVRELIARVKALLRRSEQGEERPEVIRVGKLVIDSGRRQVRHGEQSVDLTATEFDLLRALAEGKGKVIAREDLILAARGEESTSMDRTVDVHVASLRRKLGRAGGMVQTVRGVGYRLSAKE